MVAVYKKGPCGVGGPECWLSPHRYTCFHPALSGGDAVTGERGEGTGVSALLLITARESTVTLNKNFNFGKGPNEFRKLCVLDSSQPGSLFSL